MLILAAIQVLLTGAVALVGSFADGGDVFSRGILVGLHPIAAVALLVGLLAPAAPLATRRVIMGLLALNILADLGLAISIAAGVQQGDAWLPLLFAIIPAIGLTYYRLRPQAR
ncbi:MAG: hypothetical protein F4Z31_21480 [Gemmatimonadetes bacterium]|nr:hypothetical protein [Gemmatimonadota bacterium]